MATAGGCASANNRYALIEESLRSGDPARAADIVEKASKEYGSESQVLYKMDRGMILHLAGQYALSNDILEQAEAEVEQLYTRHVRTETAAFMMNDTKLPYEGEPYEQTMINVIKALNYAALGQWNEALVEARRLDHRLNVFSDRIKDKNTYREDGFARYLTGILYEATGDLNNAYIAYRRAYENYRDSAGWAHTPMPPQLRVDLLRLSDALHISDEHEEYKRQWGDVAWRPYHDIKALGQIVVVTYNGRAPRKEDQFVDVPVSLDALNLVLLTKVAGSGHANTPERRATESALYAMNGRVVRIALPTLIPQKSAVGYEEVTVTGPAGSVQLKTELAQNVTALAENAMSSRLKAVAVKAVARAVMKFAAAEGVARGAQAAAGHDAGPLVGLAVGIIAHAAAVGSEEADKRLWRTLPDEIQLGRTWVPPGDYDVSVEPLGRDGRTAGRGLHRPLQVKAGGTQLIIQRVVN